jgi:hypothetical protein
MNKILSTCVTLVYFKIFALLYSRVGAGAASNFYPEPDPELEPHKNDAAPQHWLKLYFSIDSVRFLLLKK